MGNNTVDRKGCRGWVKVLGQLIPGRAMPGQLTPVSSYLDNSYLGQLMFRATHTSDQENMKYVRKTLFCGRKNQLENFHYVKAQIKLKVEIQCNREKILSDCKS